jgi:ADP-ribose pyrophosphatase
LKARVRTLSSRTIYKGKIVTLKVDRVLEPGKITATREIVQHPGSVVVLARLGDGGVLLVRQFRYATGRSLWELVAGGLEPGESARRAAQRELLEETGYRARMIRPIFEFYSSPGFVSERMHLVEAQDLSLEKPQPESDEHIQVRKFTPAELKNMVEQKKIVDAKTLIGLLWLFNSVTK